MKNKLAWSALGSSLVLGFVMVHGCAFSPFDPPYIEERPGQTTGNTSSSSSSTSSSSSSGSSCICDGVDDGDECTTDVIGECPGGDMSKCHEIAVAKPCSAGPNHVCNAAGECVPDCNNCTNEPGCSDRCNGLLCMTGAGCASGYCEQGVCCEAACAGPCRSCNREGSVGSCRELPMGTDVLGCTSANGMACGNAGECVTQAGLVLGAACNTADQCMSKQCNVAICVSSIGEPCVENFECITRLCDPISKTCKPCLGAGSVPCPAPATCSPEGYCQSLPGDPATVDTECAQSTVVRLLCTLPEGSKCARPEECASRNCVNGSCAPFCMKDTDCFLGTTCDLSWNQCKLPTGSRCIPGSAQMTSCQSGKCSGFPPRCE